MNTVLTVNVANEMVTDLEVELTSHGLSPIGRFPMFESNLTSLVYRISEPSDAYIILHNGLRASLLASYEFRIAA